MLTIGQAMAADTTVNRNVWFPVQVTLTDETVKLKDPAKSSVCLPSKTHMQVVSSSTDGNTLFLIPRWSKNEKKDCLTQEVLDEGHQYSMSKDAYQQAAPASTGLAAGALVVPFKYYTGGDHSFTGNAAIGGYVGWRYNDAAFGYSLTPIVFFGGTSIAAKDSAGKDQNFSGLSYGAGLIGGVGSNFQLGVVLGWDRISSSAGWVNNNKPWLALEVGYSFLQ